MRKSRGDFGFIHTLQSCYVGPSVCRSVGSRIGQLRRSATFQDRSVFYLLMFSSVCVKGAHLLSTTPVQLGLFIKQKSKRKHWFKRTVSLICVYKFSVSPTSRWKACEPTRTKNAQTSFGAKTDVTTATAMVAGRKYILILGSLFTAV